MEPVITYLNDNSNALMVIITAIYVMATIAICAANIVSAYASNKQMQEAKQEYAETRRLEMMPYLQFEAGSMLGDHNVRLSLSSDMSDVEKNETIRITNIGLGTAKDITYTWTNLSGSYDRGAFPIKALRGGDSQQIRFYFTFPKEREDSFMVSIDLVYNDLINNHYTQRFELIFSYIPTDIGLKEFITFPPENIKEDRPHV